ncbi:MULTISPECIES: hypothetical protein [Bacillus]|uniref:Lantibiotic cytolysin n=1 Tax=Bacillus xiapuensis TaxID=2014075 RepID=A0ABU6NFV7_9BACI|nr:MULTISPECIES: hypothetical protein [Bacillus]MED3564262.1 hypothetical protein [Bacillus xiapuensis]
MEKNQTNQDLTLNKKTNDEELVISSTGYGLESVSKKETSAETERSNPSCGGL